MQFSGTRNHGNFESQGSESSVDLQGIFSSLLCAHHTQGITPKSRHAMGTIFVFTDSILLDL